MAASEEMVARNTSLHYTLPTKLSIILLFQLRSSNASGVNFVRYLFGEHVYRLCGYLESRIS